MGCCGGKEGEEAEETRTFKKGDARDISEGPLKNRGCTDCYCIIVYAAVMVIFVIITIAGMETGNYEKLYRPRDWSGAFCAQEENWNGGPNLADQPKLTYFMNLTTTLDLAVKETVCSTHAQTELTNLYNAGTMSQTEYNTMLCACCITPCDDCTGSLPINNNYRNISDLASSISDQLVALTSYAATDNTLFTSGGPNGDLFTNMFEEASKYFVQSCTTACEFSDSDLTRSYTYVPAGDNKLAYSWNLLKTDASVNADLQSVINNDFTFGALPESMCPYDARYCVPVPGVEFEEIPASNGYCTFAFVADVTNAIGDEAANALKNTGITDLTAGIGEEFGTWFGDLEANLDSVFLVMMVAFVVGLLFLILLRFVIGCVVWSSLLIIFLLLVLGGFASFVRSYQCADAGLFESGMTTASNIVATGEDAVTNTVNSATNDDYVARSEDMTGDGEDYRGAADSTISGKTCMEWSATSPHTPTYTAAGYPNADLVSNYCRNPDGDAPTIWCYTTDVNTVWETCNPIGTIVADCAEGYAVESSDGRKVLEILAYIIWCLAALWLLAVMCMCKQIRLAVAINEVAAQFVSNNPWVVLQPVVQTIIAILWTCAWIYAAAFLISQVPDDHVPMGPFASYADAYGDEGYGGQCTNNAPVGGVYKDELADTCVYDATAGLIPACWKCTQPRHYIKFENYRFWISLFTYLWNYAFIIACGQTIIAGAVGIWFFTPKGEKWGKACICRAVWNVFRYHAGSLLFGSFILALVQTFRYMMRSLEKQAQAQKNKVMEYVLKCVQCCLYCFEQCIKFLNKNAFIQVALLGTNFCVSAKAAFWLIFRNALRFAWVAILGNVTQLIGVTFITTSTAIVGWFAFRELAPEAVPILPMLIFILFGYVVGKLYLNVFALSVDTCLQCFIAVEEMGGEPAEEDKKYVPGALADMVNSKKPEDTDPTGEYTS